MLQNTPPLRRFTKWKVKVYTTIKYVQFYSETNINLKQFSGKV